MLCKGFLILTGANNTPFNQGGYITGEEMTAASRTMFGSKEPGASNFRNIRMRAKHSIFRGKVARKSQHTPEK